MVVACAGQRNSREHGNDTYIDGKQVSSGGNNEDAS